MPASAPPAAGRLTVVPQTVIDWPDVHDAVSPWHVIRLADPTNPLAQRLGLFGFMLCPGHAHLIGSRGHRQLRLTLWIYGDVARCLACGYEESLEDLHYRLDLGVRV